MEILKILTAALSLAVVAADFQEICLTSHNKLRALHKKTPPMKWDPTLAESAQKWAEHLAEIKEFHHDESEVGVGENLYGGTGLRQASCAEAALSWYNESKNYNYDNPVEGSSGTTGHFVQMVWSSAIRLGVGVATYKIDTYTKTVIVANYYPAAKPQSSIACKENVHKRIDPHAKVPSKYDLDPSLCADLASENTCKMFKSYGFCDPSSQEYEAMKYECIKTCNFC